MAMVMTAASVPHVNAEEYLSVFDVLTAVKAVAEVKAGEESPVEDFVYSVNEDGESVTTPICIGKQTADPGTRSCSRCQQ